MASAFTCTVLQHLQKLVSAQSTRHLGDQQLLERFTSQREEAAFAALVQRHGRLVLGVCQRVLRNGHDAEDAFQATFLVLARKAASICKQDSVASWLYRVAYRTALHARARRTSRQAYERQAAERQPADPLDEITGRELLAVLDEEVQRLPERYRLPVLLCYLEGRTHEQAAQQLGWSRSTVKRRLEQARKRLQSRLTRRGLTLAGVLLTTQVAYPVASAAVSARLAAATVQAAVQGVGVTFVGRKLNVSSRYGARRHPIAPSRS